MALAVGLSACESRRALRWSACAPARALRLVSRPPTRLRGMSGNVVRRQPRGALAIGMLSHALRRRRRPLPSRSPHAREKKALLFAARTEYHDVAPPLPSSGRLRIRARPRLLLCPAHSVARLLVRRSGDVRAQGRCGGTARRSRRERRGDRREDPEGQDLFTVEVVAEAGTRRQASVGRPKEAVEPQQRRSSKRESRSASRAGLVRPPHAVRVIGTRRGPSASACAGDPVPFAAAATTGLFSREARRRNRADSAPAAPRWTAPNPSLRDDDSSDGNESEAAAAGRRPSAATLASVPVAPSSRGPPGRAESLRPPAGTPRTAHILFALAGR